MDLEAELAAFCETNYPKVVGLLSLYTGRVDIAEELSQEALALACRDWRKVKGMESPSGWLYRTSMNLANSYFRRRSAERRANAKVAADGPSMVASPDVDAAAIRSAVAELPRRQRGALVARYYLDLSVSETARLMECSEGTVKALTHQALKGLRSSADSWWEREAPDVY